MGKSKQRTKNNTKPSSSQRSAVLLEESGVSFAGFSNLNEGGFLSYLKNVDMNHIDPNFQLLLKKMNKKDCKTKYKALLEFADLCRDAELSDVEATLPFWPRLYCSLAIDVERKVREAAQIAHGALTKRVGKKIATHLKQLAGVWFVSQYDTYAPASSAAMNAFNETFPANKFVSAIIHCQDEILKYIWQNITVETPQSMSVNKSLTPEEMESKYQRVVISSLQAYSAYLKTVPLEEVEKTKEMHQKILNDGKFWKLGKHTEAVIKTAFYGVLSAFIGHASCLSKEEKKKIVSTIMNNIDETDPPLVAGIWECVILAINVIEDWHQMINVEKALLPKMYFILKNSGRNCATIIYPNLLPLLSNLMKLNIDKKTMYIRLFENMKEGMQMKKVVISRSEIQIIITTFFECFRYVVHSNNIDFELCNSLMKEQLIPTIKTTFSETASQRSIYYVELASLVRYWSKNRETIGSNCYAELINSFWTELTILYKDLEQSASDLLCISDFSDLLVLLRNPSMKIRRHMKVTFSDSANSEKDNSKDQIQILDDDEQFNNEIEKFIISFCKSCFEEVIKHPCRINYENLIQLASKFQSQEFFGAFAKIHNENGSLLKFYNETLKPWILNNKNEATNIMPLVFIILDYVSQDEQNQILNSLLQFEDRKLLFNALQCALSNKNNPSIKEWCHSKEITDLLIDIAKKIVENTSTILYPQSDITLKNAFKIADDGGTFISEDAINGVSSVICTALNNIDASPSEFIIPVASMSSESDINMESDLTHAVETESSSHSLTSTLLTMTFELLELSLEHSKIFGGSIQMLETVLLLNISEDWIENFDIDSDSWKKVLFTMVPKMLPEQLSDLIKNFSLSLWKNIFNSCRIKVKDSLINIASMFLKVIYDNKESDEFSELVLLFLTTLDIKQWIKNVYEIILSAEVLSGNLYVEDLQLQVKIWDSNYLVDLTNGKVDNCIDKCLKWAVMSMKVLNKLNDFIKEEDETVYINIPVVTKIVIDIIKLARKYKIYYKSNQIYNDVNLLLDNLKFEFDVVRPSKKLYSEDISDTLDQIESNTIPDSKEINTLIRIRNMDPGEEKFLCFNQTMDQIVQRNSLEPSILLQESNIHQADWDKITLPLELIRTIAHYINNHPKNVTSFQWDFILISLASWQHSVNQSKNYYYSFKVMTFTIAVCELYYAVQNLMLKHEKEPIDEIPPELLDEWKNVFMDNIHAGIAKTWMLYSSLNNQSEIPLRNNLILESVGKALQLVDRNIFFKETPEINVTNTELINLSLKLLESPILGLQLNAYHALNLVNGKLIKKDEEMIKTESWNVKSLNIYMLENTLTKAQSLMDEMLSDKKLCNMYNSLIEPYSEVYNSTVGYLLAWSVVLDMCAKADGDLRYHYAEMLKNDLFSSLMNNIFKLIPPEILQDSKVKHPKLVEIFNNVPSLNFGECWTTVKLQHLVCWVYTNCLRYLPVLVRQWWSTTDSRISVIVDRITTAYVSPILCQEELNNKMLTTIENIQIKVHPSTREVIAIYEMDDLKLELSIALPVNYPLGPVAVVPGQNIRGSTNWSNCHMQLSLFLTHQNGSIWDGLMLWKKNLDKKFTGVEECYICFSILHFNTYQLPKLSCRTCRKKFHKSCLYKWFNTSQKSTCPICRNVF